MRILAAPNFLTGARYMDPRYGNISEVFYQVFPSLQWIDISYGLILIAIAGYQIYTRFQLAGFKHGAPKKLLWLYAVSIIAGFAYIFSSSTAVTLQLIKLNEPDAAEKVWSFAGSSMWSLIPDVIMFLINKKYYYNRKELFVN